MRGKFATIVLAINYRGRLSATSFRPEADLESPGR
jgi:hypothetical protein